MKILKRSLFVVLIFVFLFFLLSETSVPASAVAADSGTCGKKLTWTLDDGVLTISGKGKMADYDAHTNRAPWAELAFKKVIIEDGVTEIAGHAFYGCTGLKSVKIPDSVTIIGSNAFHGCTALKSVTIPASVVSLQSDAFGGCTALESVTIPKGVTFIGSYVFENCTSLTSVKIPEGVTSIGSWAFNGCSALESVTIPESVKTINDAAFRGCTSLRSVKIPEGVSSVKYSTFSNCESLTSITLPDSITTIELHAFWGCTGLKSIKISENVTLIGGSAFKNCSDLDVIMIPKSVKTIGKTAFQGCTDLKKIVFKGNAPKCSETDYPLDGLTATAYYPKGNDSWTKSAKSLIGENADITWKSYASGKTPWITPLEITKQPKTTYTQLGEKAKFTVKAEGDGLTYQWYYKDADGTKYKKSSITSATYSLKMTEARKDRKLYCKITDAYGNTVKSKTVTMRMAASIKTQPKTQYVQLGEKAKFTVKAVGDDLTYQWYYKSAGSSKYKKASCTKSSYTITQTEARRDRKFYCIVTDKKGNEVKSKTVTMKMAASIKTEPKSVKTSIGKKAKFTVKAVGDDLTYQWYYKDTDDKKYKKASGTKATYSIELTKARNGRKFYCVVTDKYGNTVKTKTVSMKKK